VWYKLFQRESDEIDIHMMSGYQEGPKVKKKSKTKSAKTHVKAISNALHILLLDAIHRLNKSSSKRKNEKINK